MANRIIRPLIGRNCVLGHDTIDLDHMAIADCWYRAVNCEQIQFPFLIARLKKAMGDHFNREAALMERAGGALCRCHRQEHQTLLDLCNDASALGRTNWRKSQSLLQSKLPKLIREHIMFTDQLAVLFINTNGATALKC